jgi:hypothetical protein
MTSAKIGSVFKLIQGHQITDEEIYHSFGLGKIPIYTSSSELKGYWNKALVSQDDLPCITYPTKANRGEAFIQTEIFDANNTAVLIPLEDWRGHIILEWVCFKLSEIFPSIATSKEGVSYLNREIVEEQVLEIPSKTVQQDELRYYKQITSLKYSVEHITGRIDRLLQLSLLVQDTPKEDIKLSELFDYSSRNDCLSEEGIYHRSEGLRNAGEIITVISGSTDQFYGLIPFDVDLHIVRNKPCLQVITRGDAGKIKFINKGNYATNTNSMLLTLKDDQKNSLHIYNDIEEVQLLKFYGMYLQAIFLDYCSSADLSVFPLTEAIKTIAVPKFKLNQGIVDTVTKYDSLSMSQEQMKQVSTHLDHLLHMQLVG